MFLVHADHFQISIWDHIFEVSVVLIFIQMWQLEHLYQNCLRCSFKMEIIRLPHLLHQTLWSCTYLNLCDI